MQYTRKRCNKIKVLNCCDSNIKFTQNGKKSLNKSKRIKMLNNEFNNKKDKAIEALDIIFNLQNKVK